MDTVIERVPPYNLEAEQALLGSMMLDLEAVNIASEILQPEDFYRESHRVIFLALLDLEVRGEPIDMITLTEELRQQNNLEKVGGVSYVATLANIVPKMCIRDRSKTLVITRLILSSIQRLPPP